MDMESRAYEKELKQLVEEGAIDEALLDDAVRRILKVKVDLGLFDDPYKYCDEEREKQNTLSAINLEVARDAARKSIVLLKNENNLLPLSKTGGIVGVIGALANDKDIPLGSWRAQAIENSAVSLLEGIESVVGPENTRFAEGYRITEGNRSFLYELNILENDRSGFDEAVNVAKNCEVVILAMGEDCWQTGEGRSQTDIGLKGSQEALLAELLKANKNVIVVLMSGRSLAIPFVAETVPALVQSWHLGSEAGNAIADVLFGDYNPSGKLPVSFPRHGGQVPVYYNHKNTGRPKTNPHDDGMVFWSHYTDALNTPLFPFGFGLSYTSFEYSDLQISDTTMKLGEKITATIEVRNTGTFDGHEVVQLYLRDHVGSSTRPVKELKEIQKIFLKKGEAETLTFEINQQTLSFYRADKQFGCEPGDFTVMVGGSSDRFLEKEFTLN